MFFYNGYKKIYPNNIQKKIKKRGINNNLKINILYLYNI